MYTLKLHGLLVKISFTRNTFGIQTFSIKYKKPLYYNLTQ